MEEQISILVELSRADRGSHQLRERHGAIPKDMERHDREFRQKSAQLAAHQTRIDDSQRERRALERDADQAKARRRELELQQFRVKNQIEYQALAREIEEMRRRASDFEDRGLELLKVEEEEEQAVAELREQVALEEAKVREVRERLSGELAALTAQLEEADRKRQELLDRLSPKVRHRYERIIRSKGDLAVVGIVGGACGGCFYQLPPQRVAEVRKRDRLIVCEGCGRLLVWDD